MKGFLLIDKPKGVTSFDVVGMVRKATGVKKVGHAGTLDPLATGLLLVAVGEGTKLLEYFVGMDKEYEVLGRFGFVSNTYDADGEISEVDISKKIAQGDIVKIIKENFLGEIQQQPPVYSAIKLAGKKAYELAREGREVVLEKRKVRINNYEVLDFAWPEVKFRIACSSGTYVRSLIHDLGQILQCGGYVQELRRTKVGNFSVEQAFTFKEFADISRKIEPNLKSLEEIVGDFEKIDLSDQQFAQLKDGRVSRGEVLVGGFVMGFYENKLVGIIENSPDNRGVKYRKMIL